MDLSKYFCKKPSDVSDEDALRYLLDKAKEDIIIEAKNQVYRQVEKARARYFRELTKNNNNLNTH